MRKTAKIVSSKKVIFISESEELYKSFKRALKVINNIDMHNILNGDNLFNYNDEPFNTILLYVKSREDKYTLLWEKMIIGQKCNIPIIAIGYHKLNIAEDLRDLVFEKEETRVSYRYFQIPFSLAELRTAMFEVKPFPKNKLSFLVKTYCNWRGILDLILRHEIPNRLGDGSEGRAIAIDLYKKVKEILSMVKASTEIISECDEAIQKIETQGFVEFLEQHTTKAKKIADQLKKESFNE